MAQYRITQIEDYGSLVGTETIQRIRQKAANLKGLRVANFNSTYYGGGVAERIAQPNGTRGARNCSEKFSPDALPRTTSRSLRRAVKRLGRFYDAVANGLWPVHLSALFTKRRPQGRGYSG
jgi:hypothetical protein